MDKDKKRYNDLSSTEIGFVLIMASYFVSLVPIFMSDYHGPVIACQGIILISLFEVIRKKIPFTIILRSRPFLWPVTCVVFIFLLNTLLVGWFSIRKGVAGFSSNDLALVALHFTLFSIGFVKLIGIQTVNRHVTAIYGAGVAGQQLHQQLMIEGDYTVLFFIDDDAPKGNSKVEGLQVLSRDVFIQSLHRAVDSVYVAIPTITGTQLNALICSLEGLNVEVKKLPSLKDIPMGIASLQLMSSVDEADLIGRRTVVPDAQLLQRNITDKVVLVSGAGGSIGSAICLEIIKHSPREIVLFDISEFGLYKINQALEGTLKAKQNVKVSLEMGSIQSLSKVKSIFANYSIEMVFHAAAYKHVPLVELNLLEAFKNNVLGTKNLVSEAVNGGVENFVLISSDKAVRPTNFMGVTKRLCELVCQSYSGNDSKTIISMVRFGNVLGSSGSVVPLFKDQISLGGPVTVTHPDITRYFMTIEEAAELVIQASGLASGGETFVLDMGEPIKILDLAKRMIALSGKDACLVADDRSINNILIEFTGLRPGEKMYEELFFESGTVTTGHPQIDKCDQSFFEAYVLGDVLSRLQGALEDGFSRDRLKEIVNELPVCYEPSN